MTAQDQPLVAVVIPVGPGKEAVLDTLDSLEAFCEVPYKVILIDDRTNDGTYEALLSAKQSHWELLRNDKRCGWEGIVHTLCFGYEQAITRTDCKLILKLDVDALLIKHGLFSDAVTFMERHREVGMFGVYEADYNGPRDLAFHRRLFMKETAWYRALLGMRPYWRDYLAIAESKGYNKGENVFGGAYFLTRECVEAMVALGALKIPWRWHSRIAEDVYFSMLTVAGGFRMGHFAAPDGPLCMAWRGLPFPARTLDAGRFKLVHSVDKGPNTGQVENGGRTAREVFRELRTKVKMEAGPAGHCGLHSITDECKCRK